MLTTDAYTLQCGDDNPKISIDIHRPSHAINVNETTFSFTKVQGCGYDDGKSIDIPKQLSDHIKQKLAFLEKTFIEKPFIQEYFYEPTDNIVSKNVDTYSGTVVLNTDGKKVMLKPDASQIPMDNFNVGQSVKLNYVMHYTPCVLTSVVLSNQTNRVTDGNLTDIITNPSNHGIFNQTESKKLFSIWVWGKDTTHPTIHSDENSYWEDYSHCATKTSYTYELVSKN